MNEIPLDHARHVNVFRLLWQRQFVVIAMSFELFGCV
jgi:hypothetical protein